MDLRTRVGPGGIVVIFAGLLALAAGGAAVALGAFESDPARTCRASAGARLCVVEHRRSYILDGTGFRPGSQLTLADPAAGRPMVVDASATGEVPGQGGTLGVLRGSEAQELTVTGTASGGDEVRFQFTVPPTGE